jgi:hypothetical protein
MCPFGVAWADTAAGDLNHDGEITIRAESGGTAITNGFTTAANRREILVDDAYGYVLSQYSNKLVPEYFPVYTGAADNVIVGQDGKPVGGYVPGHDEAHFYAECSGRGSCERGTGQCSCFGGFTGSACQRSECAADCSGNGVCLTAKEVAAGSRVNPTAATTGRNYRVSTYFATYNTYSGLANTFTYNHWDSDKSQMCVCDSGFTGHDCSMRSCPLGRDPLVAASSICGNEPCRAEVQALYIKLKVAAASNPDPLTIRFGYQDKYGVNPARTLFSNPLTLDAGQTAFAYREQISRAFNTFPNNILANVNISVSAAEDGVTGALVNTMYPQMQALSDANDIIEFKIDFGLGPQGDVEPVSVHYVSGALATFDFGSVHDVSGARASVTGTSAQTPAAGAFFSTVADQLEPLNGNTPYTECSNRGICDHAAGVCDCFTGYFGPSCTFQNALAQ